jgi:hypothetical protein
MCVDLVVHVYTRSSLLTFFCFLGIFFGCRLSLHANRKGEREREREGGREGGREGEREREREREREILGFA